MQFPPIKKGGANVPNSNVGPANPVAVGQSNPADNSNYVKNIKKNPQ
jgi:hypothetical protein